MISDCHGYSHPIFTSLIASQTFDVSHHVSWGTSPSQWYMAIIGGRWGRGLYYIASVSSQPGPLSRYQACHFMQRGSRSICRSSCGYEPRSKLHSCACRGYQTAGEMRRHSQAQAQQCNLVLILFNWISLLAPRRRTCHDGLLAD